MMHSVFIFLFLVLTVTASSQSFHPIPEVQDPVLFNSQLQYTASLLHKKNSQVRVLVYGQSISEQDWWKEVRSFFEKSYPDVDLVFENSAIGGFSSERLKITTENDIISFYPDLVLFHDYGNEEDYERIISIIKSKTTADIAIQTDHMALQDQMWHDRHGDVWLPELCRKYGLALLDVRRYWKLYLQENDLKITDLLTDGVHLNDHGNYVMAETIKAYFSNLKQDSVGDNRLTTLKRGKDFLIDNASITLSFTGNRVDVSMDKPGQIDVLLDNAPLHSNKGCYYYTRPALKSTGAFLTKIGSIIAVDLSGKPQEEDWSLKVLSVDSMKQLVEFSLYGTKTGEDGTGESSKRFTSKSGRITIQPNAWFVRRHNGDFAQHSWIKPGDVIQWQTKSMCRTSAVLSGSATETLLQGVSNTRHQLKISGPGASFINEIIVYTPMLKHSR